VLHEQLTVTIRSSRADEHMLHPNSLIRSRAAISTDTRSTQK